MNPTPGVELDVVSEADDDDVDDDTVGGRSSDESLGAPSSLAPDAASAFASCNNADNPTRSTMIDSISND